MQALPAIRLNPSRRSSPTAPGLGHPASVVGAVRTRGSAIRPSLAEVPDRWLAGAFEYSSFWGSAFPVTAKRGSHRDVRNDPLTLGLSHEDTPWNRYQ
jgi:hypothetical protein